MSRIVWISALLLITPLLAAPQYRKPFLQRLIEDGFASSETNVVYFIYSKTVNAGLFGGSFPKILITGLEGESKRIKGQNQQFNIAAQSLVVIDARNEPMHNNRCLIYLIKELQRVRNPGSNKFVLLVDKTFPERLSLQYLRDALLNLGIGYAVVLPYDQVNSPHEPRRLIRISFTQQLTARTTKFPNLRRLFRLNGQSLDGMRVSGALFQFFPFSYITPSRQWAGTDYYLWSLISTQLRLRLEFKYVNRAGPTYSSGAYSLAMLNKSVNFVATRDMAVLDDAPKLHLTSRDYFNLVVPKPVKLNLIDAMVQPFNGTVWLMIGVLLGVRVFAGYLQDLFGLLDRSGKVCKWWYSLQAPHCPCPQWVQLAADVLTFLLIEAYLAQVTSLLLTLRFIEGPRDLNEFIASNIRIVEPYESTLSLVQVETGQRALLKTRFVKRTAEELARPNQDDAFVELRSRVAFQSYGTEPFDPVTGRRNFYLLDEPLADVRFQYSFAKETAFMGVAQDYMLRCEENGLRMRMDESFERWAKIQHLRKEYGINGTVLEFSDLNSLWICMGIGWLSSGLLLLAERFVHSRMVRRAS
ncbi:uncharacterized protein LOC133393969 [Anopheles gambiae]|uniref:uncharacterized protein LOC133393969 n=1 Tax=Anopheles gambiae TaxID=7165 RepID=UPI002AC9A253|nr:uncharacterized protein LOC133393969 [Anopheles gambiae]